MNSKEVGVDRMSERKEISVPMLAAWDHDNSGAAAIPAPEACRTSGESSVYPSEPDCSLS
jgi:hypothetical protein